MASVSETVYIGYDNGIDLLFKAGGTAQDLSSVSRIKLIESTGLFEIDSQKNPEYFDWDTGVTGKLTLALGLSEIAAGSYTFWVVMYDQTNQNGVMWSQALKIKFK